MTNRVSSLVKGMLTIALTIQMGHGTENRNNLASLNQEEMDREMLNQQVHVVRKFCDYLTILDHVEGNDLNDRSRILRAAEDAARKELKECSDLGGDCKAQKADLKEIERRWKEWDADVASDQWELGSMLWGAPSNRNFFDMAIEEKNRKNNEILSKINKSSKIDQS